MSNEEIVRDVKLLNNAMFGDRENPKESPGVVADIARMGMEQARTNEILTELTGSVRWINRLILGSIVVAVLGLIVKNHP